MSFRKFIFWPHLVVGLLAGVVILIMSVTGVLLTYEKQMVRWSEWDERANPPAGATTRMAIDALVAKVRAAEGRGTEATTPPTTPPTTAPTAPSNVTVYADPAAPVLLTYGRERRLLVNAYTGEVIGEGSPRLRAFFQSVTAWHRWLAMEGASRETAKAVTGACNLAFLFLVVSGAYLWFPRRWSVAALKAVTVPRLGLRGKARDWNWHNALGFWAAVPLFLVVLSGVVISYPWAVDVVYRAVGSKPPPRRGPGGPGGASGSAPTTNPAGERGSVGRGMLARGTGERRTGERGTGERGVGERGGPRPEGGFRRGGERLAESRPVGAGDSLADVSPTNMAALWAAAERYQPGWTSISHAWPLVREGKATFTVDTGTGAQPQAKTQLTLDAATAAVVKAEGWSEMEIGRKARSVLRFTHTGEILGLFGQTVAGLASLAAVVLVYTGFALSFRRFFPHRAAASREARTENAAAVTPSA